MDGVSSLPEKRVPFAYNDISHDYQKSQQNDDKRTDMKERVDRLQSRIKHIRVHFFHSGTDYARIS